MSQTYSVTCFATRVYRVEFLVDADSPEEAIRFAKAREDCNGQSIFEDSEEFEETVEETSWEASPSDYQATGGAA